MFVVAIAVSVVLTMIIMIVVIAHDLQLGFRHCSLSLVHQSCLSIFLPFGQSISPYLHRSCLQLAASCLQLAIGPFWRVLTGLDVTVSVAWFHLYKG